MHKIPIRYLLVSAGLIISLLLAFFPSSSFLQEPFVLFGRLGQQPYNEAGLFTVTPYQAVKYFSYHPQKCVWLDVRSLEKYNKEHLQSALNQNISQLKNTLWNPDDLILVYGDNTEDAQEAIAMLRQINNARAFAVKGGFKM